MQREDYYRVRAEGHNTLVIDPDESLVVDLVSPAGAVFEVLPASPATPPELRRAGDRSGMKPMMG